MRIIIATATYSEQCSTTSSAGICAVRIRFLRQLGFIDHPTHTEDDLPRPAGAPACGDGGSMTSSDADAGGEAEEEAEDTDENEPRVNTEDMAENAEAEDEEPEDEEDGKEEAEEEAKEQAQPHEATVQEAEGTRREVAATQLVAQACEAATTQLAADRSGNRPPKGCPRYDPVAQTAFFQPADGGKQVEARYLSKSDDCDFVKAIFDGWEWEIAALPRLQSRGGGGGRPTKIPPPESPRRAAV